LDRDLISFRVQVKETDLYIKAARNLQDLARHSILRHRFQLERYIDQRPEFFRSLVPIPDDEQAPPVARRMMWAGQKTRVGPMAAVAGALAEFVGQDLLAESAEVIVENGGDCFLRASREIRVGIFAGPSPLSLRIGVRIPEAATGWGLCTSSATVGPSLSFGKADAVCILAPSAALADAAATAVGNEVGSAAEIPGGLEKARSIRDLAGVVVIVGDQLGAWGAIELLEL